MNLPRLTWKRGLLVLVLMPLAWLAYRTCPCALEMGDERDTFRLTSQPNICAVLPLPGFWVLPEYQKESALQFTDLNYYELRRSKYAADKFFIGLRRMRPPPPVEGGTVRSTNKFAFQFHSADSQSRATVGGVRLASQEEWANSVGLPYLDTSDFKYGDIDLRGNVDGNNVVFDGRRFPKYEKYPDFSTRRMVSVNEIFIAVPSFSGPALPGGGLRFDILPNPWRRTENIDIFRVSSHARVARIRGWTCIGGLGQPRLIVWHGDEFFSMPLTADKRQVLPCDFHGL
jgi:hypothetical protein